VEVPKDYLIFITEDIN